LTTTPTTRDRLIESAFDRFNRDGFRAVGLDQILADVGISKTAFYKHFESKDELVVAVLSHMDSWLRDAFLSMIRAIAPDERPRDQLVAIFEVVEQIISKDDFRGCFFVNAILEYPLPHDPAHMAAAANKLAIEALVSQIAARAGARDPDALSEDICLVMEGAYVASQVHGAAHAAEIARRTGYALIDHSLPRAARAEVGPFAESEGRTRDPRRR
jgi:AcrR family transcriptional regulator